MLGQMESKQNYHMSAEEFRRWGHAIVDWIANTRIACPPCRCWPRRSRGDSFPLAFCASPKGRDVSKGIRRFREIDFARGYALAITQLLCVLPFQHIGAVDIGELLSAGLGVQGMLWATSPACTELETHVLDWIAEMLALPAAFRSSGTGGGVIQDSASSAVLCAILAARERRPSSRRTKPAAMGVWLLTHRPRHIHRSKRPSRSPALAAASEAD